MTALWKQHEPNHPQYLHLSAQLRDGHDKRKACVDAVVASESTASVAKERAQARLLIQASTLPFKPLPE